MGKFNFDKSDFEKVKNNAEIFYNSIGEVYSPYFKEKIAFNAKGWEHLKFKRREKPRLPQDQYMRFRLISLAVEIIKSSHTLQGIWETSKFERIRINSRTENIFKPVNYYEFIAVIKRNRVKLILKRINGGQIFFWSLIPFWGMDKSTMSRILHDGFPDED
jgi:hypothetical protein